MADEKGVIEAQIIPAQEARQLEVINNEATAVAAASKALVEARFIMAIKRPRNEANARQKILDRCKDFAFAEKALYSKPIAGTEIEGLSIRYAEEIGRLWGNLDTQQIVIYEDEKKRIVRIISIDLETNTGYSKEVTVQKQVERKFAKDRRILGERLNSLGQKVFIVEATEDEMLIKEGALASKLIRNNTLRLIPENIINESRDVIEKTLETKISKDPAAEMKKICDSFAEFRIMPLDLEAYLGCAIDKISPKQLAQLRKIYNSIKDGTASWSDFLEVKKMEKKEPEKGTLGGISAGEASEHKDVSAPLFANVSGKHKDFEAQLSKSLGGIVLSFEIIEQICNEKFKKSYKDCDENDIVALQENIFDIGKAYKAKEKFKK